MENNTPDIQGILDPNEFAHFDKKSSPSSVKLIGKTWRLSESEVVLMLQSENGDHKRFTFSNTTGTPAKSVGQFVEYLFTLHPEADIDDQV